MEIRIVPGIMIEFERETGLFPGHGNPAEVVENMVIKLYCESRRFPCDSRENINKNYLNTNELQTRPEIPRLIEIIT